MAIKTIFFLVALRIITACSASANESQMNNEYYDRPQCIRQVLSDIKASFKLCIETETQLDCAMTAEEISSMITVYCGE